MSRIPSASDDTASNEYTASSPDVSRGSKSRLLPRTIQGVELLLVAAVLVPLLFVRVSLHYGAYHERRSQEFLTSLELARVVATAFDAFIQGVVRQELAIGLTLAAAEPLTVEQANQFLAANALDYPGVRTLSWLSPRGVVVASSIGETVGEDLGASTYVREVVQGRDWSVGDLLQQQASDDVTFAVARGVHDPEGILQGIVVATMCPRGLGTETLLAQWLGERAISIRDRQGRLVFFHPDRNVAWAERDVAMAEPAVLPCLAGEEVTDTAASALDGRVHMAALAPIHSLGWVASVSRPESEAMASALAGVLIDIGLYLLVALGAVGLALYAGRGIVAPLDRLREHATVVGRGDYGQRVAPTGPREIEALAVAFNGMAQELGARDQFREDYAHTISHDLRQPLTLIYGQAQMLRRSLQEGDVGARSLRSVEAILTGSTRMDAMIQDLVDVVRLEAGRLQLRPREVDVRSYLFDLKARLEGMIEPARVCLEAPEGLPPALADLERLERILMNLLSNAFKYSPPDTTVTVSLAQAGDEIVVAVSDGGPGIPPAEQEHLFERFYRTTTGERVEGLGLGLYISRLLVEAHQGRIWLESEVGTGSTFKFTLPVAQGADSSL